MKRRTFLSGAVASAALAPVVAAAGVCEIDPAIAAIARARAAWAAFGEVVDRENTLSLALPAEVRRSDNMSCELTIVETDDPQWIAVMREYRATDDAAYAAFWAVLAKENHPTTLAGVAALLHFSADGNMNGAPAGEWHDEDTGITEGWEQAIARMCADVLLRLASCPS